MTKVEDIKSLEKSIENGNNDSIDNYGSDLIEELREYRTKVEDTIK